ncbi:MAG: hypothetical protein SWY16_24415 [Cyanobacteriota bacterium]|nr:hypothetical protein [Cyanobacteriota bacterium]
MSEKEFISQDPIAPDPIPDRNANSIEETATPKGSTPIEELAADVRDLTEEATVSESPTGQTPTMSPWMAPLVSPTEELKPIVGDTVSSPEESSSDRETSTETPPISPILPTEEETVETAPESTEAPSVAETPPTEEATATPPTVTPPTEETTATPPPSADTPAASVTPPAEETAATAPEITSTPPTEEATATPPPSTDTPPVSETPPTEETTATPPPSADTPPVTQTPPIEETTATAPEIEPEPTASTAPPAEESEVSEEESTDDDRDPPPPAGGTSSGTAGETASGSATPSTKKANSRKSNGKRGKDKSGGQGFGFFTPPDSSLPPNSTNDRPSKGWQVGWLMAILLLLGLGGTQMARVWESRPRQLAASKTLNAGMAQTTTKEALIEELQLSPVTFSTYAGAWGISRYQPQFSADERVKIASTATAMRSGEHPTWQAYLEATKEERSLSSNLRGPDSRSAIALLPQYDRFSDRVPQVVAGAAAEIRQHLDRDVVEPLFSPIAATPSSAMASQGYGDCAAKAASEATDPSTDEYLQAEARSK